MTTGIATTMSASTVGLTHTASTGGVPTVEVLASKITKVKLPKTSAVKPRKFHIERPVENVYPRDQQCETTDMYAARAGHGFLLVGSILHVILLIAIAAAIYFIVRRWPSRSGVK